MNILIPHTWLLEHLQTEATPKQIQEKLSLCGPSVERIYKLEDEGVYDIEVTTNRVDSMSVRGIAREAAVILKQFGLKAKLKPLKLNSQPKLETQALPLPKIYNDPKLNKRTMAVILANIKRSPTPAWMAKRLKQIDMNVHDACIDITNYVTHELGHPCHAFDYDKLMATGGEIHIKEAKAGEKFKTLDGETYTTVGGEVVFKNKTGQIIDLPSIKGTANTSVDENTKNIFLLLESIKPQKVRFASMTHAIRTTAAQLLEKNLDPNLMDENILLGIKLYQELCSAKVASQIYDDFPTKITPKTIKINKSKIQTYLGLKLVTSVAQKNQLSLKRIEEILTALGCKVELEKTPQLLSKDFVLEVTPPTFRPDLKIPADIIEEISRIYGYHRLPSNLPIGAIPTKKQPGVDFLLENKIKHLLADLGWQEVYTYSMVSEELARESDYKLTQQLKLQNPLSEDRVYLRRSLLPSLTEFINSNPLKENLSIFELANIYEPQKDGLPKEKLILGLVSKKPYRQVMGDIETLFEKLFTKLTIKQANKNQAELLVAGKKLGELSFKNNLTKISLNFKEIIKIAKRYPQYQPILKSNAVVEDLTFTLPANIKVGNLISEISKLDNNINKIELKDIFKQNYTFSINYLNKNKTLNSEEIIPIREKVIKLVHSRYEGKLVGQV